MRKHFKKFGLLSVIVVSFVFIFGLRVDISNVYAASSGTSDGTYDFGGPLKADNSGGAGYAIFADKFVVSNGFAIEGKQLWSQNQQVANTTGTLVIKAEGTAKCRTFTFKDLGISSYESANQNLTSLSVVLKDGSGVTIATLSSSGTVILTNTTAQLSSLLGASTYSYDNVASVTITWKFANTLAPSNLNFDNITIANVVGADVTPPTISDGTLNASNITATGVTLNWTKATDAVSPQSVLQYQVYRSSSNNINTVANIEANGTPVGSYTADIGSYGVAGLTESTTYYFNVIVKDEAGNKTAYTPKQVVTSDITSPVVLLGTIGTTGLTDTAVTLNWTKATDVVSPQSALQYQVYRSSSNNINTVANIEANGTPVGSYTADIGSYGVAGLTESTTYYFNVIVKDEAGNKTAYTPKQVVTSDITSPVVLVGTIGTTGLTDTGVTLNWTKATDVVSPQGALQYRVYRSSSNNINTVANMEANGTPVVSYTADIGTYNVTGLMESTTYYFNVIVKDEAGNKTAYMPKQVVTSDITPPVVSVGTISTTGLTDTEVTLNWTKATDTASPQSALQYQVYRSSNNNINTVANIEANGTPVGSYTADIATYSVTGLTESTTYYFNVIVKDEAGNKTAYTPQQVVTSDITSPTVSVGTISTTGLTDTEVTLNWTKATDVVTSQSALQYQVYRSSSNNINTVANIEANGTPVVSYTADIGTYNVTGLTESTTYYLNIIVKDGAGNKTAYTMNQVTTKAAPTFTIDPIDNQSVASLTVGYAAGTQETKSITIARTGTGILTNLKVALSGTNANDFVIVQPDETTLDGAVPSTTFTVKALDRLEVGTHNATITVTADNMAGETFTLTQIVKPVEPTTIVSAVSGDGYVTLTWNSVGMEGYEIFQSTVSGSYGAAVETVSSSVYSSKITGLVNGTTYFFVVRSIHGGIESEASNEVSSMPQVAAPDVPVLQSAIPGDGQVNVSWTPVIGSTEYQIFSSDRSGSYSAPLATVSGSVYSYDAVGLVNGTTYYFVIKALNPGGESAASNEASAIPQVASPSVPSILSVTAGNGLIRLTWSKVAGSTEYKVFKSTVAGTYTEDATTVSGSVYSYEATGLNNGTTYYFIVKASNPGGESPSSNEVSAVPKTVPAAPTGVVAIAGDRQVTVSFVAPADNGGSEITGYEIIGLPGNILLRSTSSSVIFTGLTNGTTYTFKVKAINSAGTSEASEASNEVTPKASPSQENSGGGSGGSGAGSSGSENTNTSAQLPIGLDVLINGRLERIGTATTTIVDGQTVTKVTVDSKRLTEKLVAEGQKAVITIPVSIDSDVVIGEFDGQMVQNMEQQQAVVVIKTANASYTLPAEQIDINAISEKLGQNVALQDIKVQITIAKLAADSAKIVEDAASKGGLTVVVPPLHFSIKAAFGDTTIEVSRFNEYVERIIAIPDGVDPTRITTGVVVDPDGTIRHVPTRIVVVENKHYAKVSSLTNSTYALVWHPVTFKDLENHWAKETVNDMGARMIISGLGEGIFAPSQDITRAEFAAMIVRALGLKADNSPSPFKDVQTNAWYNDYVKKAFNENIVTGFNNGTFAPDDKITREQAMVMIANAMRITGLQISPQASEAGSLLSKFDDAALASEWARLSIANCLEAGLVTGRNGNQLKPKDFISRAEVAVLVQRLLQKSGLI